MLCGASVILQCCCSAELTKRVDTEDQPQQGIVISTVAQLLGALFVTPRALLSPKPWGRPRQWWAFSGGLLVTTALVLPWASVQLGVQAMVLLQLIAMLSCTVFLDCLKGTLLKTDFLRLGGFCLVVGGAMVDVVSGSAASKGGSSVGMQIFLAACCIISGVGYVVMAKGNAVLAEDLGSMSRAMMASCVPFSIVAVPVSAILVANGFPHYSDGDWKFWVFIGAQNAFYTGSLAIIPTRLGYTATFLVLLAGKLTTSSYTDHIGFGGKNRRFDWLRACALALVLLGTALFNDVLGGCFGRAGVRKPTRSSEGDGGGDDGL
eukprot:CAMPEP_0198553096 /NCGR_PEP_ID=MMETSP1462-20131121/79849_1 /TAXON_ID=1333877 /ORGANISM="Brandtodinium nutriculum, Strain RCC3387" /LENGTH=319 /DNA_ID=CAMNT_0044283773 /DNA_START=1 /DNA_END=956 /DNA_ORIENTATION=-